MTSIVLSMLSNASPLSRWNFGVFVSVHKEHVRLRFCLHFGGWKCERKASFGEGLYIND